MACPQKEMSRGVCSAVIPCRDLNHCRSVSTSEMTDIGTPNDAVTSCVIRSNRPSAWVSSNPVACKAAIRSGSRTGVGGFTCDLHAADELEQRIQGEALTIAYLLVLVLLMTLAPMERAVGLTFEDWSYVHVWIYVPIFYLAGLAIARRRYA